MMGRPRATPGVSRGCGTPRAVSRAEVARVRGRRFTPTWLAKRRERRGRTLHFSHFARGGLARARGAAAALALGLRKWTHPSVSAPPESTFPMAWCSSFASKGAVAISRPTARNDARRALEFSRVRSDSLPAGHPSRVRGVPECLLAERSARLSASPLASARTPCAVVLCSDCAFRGDAKCVGQRKCSAKRSRFPVRGSPNLPKKSSFVVFGNWCDHTTCTSVVTVKLRRVIFDSRKTLRERRREALGFRGALAPARPPRR